MKGGFYVSPEAKLLLVVRIRGINAMHPKTKKDLATFASEEDLEWRVPGEQPHLAAPLHRRAVRPIHALAHRCQLTLVFCWVPVIGLNKAAINMLRRVEP